MQVAYYEVATNDNAPTYGYTACTFINCYLANRDMAIAYSSMHKFTKVMLP